MKGLIIAAGKGERISHRGNLKPLILLGEMSILERIFLSANKAGVNEFFVVTGYRAEEMEQFLDELSEKRSFKIKAIYNNEWEKENGISVLKAKDYINEKFFLLMSDHIFDESIIIRLKNYPLNEDEVALGIDTKIDNNLLVDLDDVTKVKKEKDRIIDIGKNLKEYNAFDTGIFLCTPAIFLALEESKQKGDDTLSGGIRTLAKSRKARVMDIGGSFWIDIDDEKAFKKAENILLSSKKGNK